MEERAIPVVCLLVSSFGSEKVRGRRRGQGQCWAASSAGQTDAAGRALECHAPLHDVTEDDVIYYS